MTLGCGGRSTRRGCPSFTRRGVAIGFMFSTRGGGHVMGKGSNGGCRLFMGTSNARVRTLRMLRNSFATVTSSRGMVTALDRGRASSGNATARASSSIAVTRGVGVSCRDGSITGTMLG